MREMSVDLPAFGEPDEPDVGEQLEVQPQVAFFSGQARLRVPRRAIRRADELRVAPAAVAALGDDDAHAGRREVGDPAIRRFARLVSPSSAARSSCPRRCRSDAS